MSGLLHLFSLINVSILPQGNISPPHYARGGSRRPGHLFIYNPGMHYENHIHSYTCTWCDTYRHIPAYRYISQAVEGMDRTKVCTWSYAFCPLGSGVRYNYVRTAIPTTRHSSSTRTLNFRLLIFESLASRPVHPSEWLRDSLFDVFMNLIRTYLQLLLLILVIVSLEINNPQ